MELLGIAFFIFFFSKLSLFKLATASIRKAPEMQNSEKGVTNISAANGKIPAVKGFSKNLVAKDILAQVSQQESMEKQTMKDKL